MARLNADILDKMQKKTGKPLQYLREQISRRASRQGVSSTAAQLMWARDLGLGIASALNKQPEVREEMRSAGGSMAPGQTRTRLAEAKSRSTGKPKAVSAATIRALLKDGELHARCKDLILANKHFDRAFREATTLLDDRLKKKTGIANMNPGNLVGKALNPDPTKAVIEVSADKAEQEGIHSICRGIMLAFRDKTHHTLSDKLTREDALTFCGFIDTILGVIDKSTIHPDRV
jgi:uncharacterized protein (TIGR02391 family)